VIYIRRTKAHPIKFHKLVIIMMFSLQWCVKEKCVFEPVAPQIDGKKNIASNIPGLIFYFVKLKKNKLRINKTKSFVDKTNFSSHVEYFSLGIIKAPDLFLSSNIILAKCPAGNKPGNFLLSSQVMNCKTITSEDCNRHQLVQQLCCSSCEKFATPWLGPDCPYGDKNLFHSIHSYKKTVCPEITLSQCSYDPAVRTSCCQTCCEFSKPYLPFTCLEEEFVTTTPEHPKSIALFINPSLSLVLILIIQPVFFNNKYFF